MLDGDDLWIGTRHDGIRILNVKTGDIRAHVYSETKPYTILSNEVNRIFRTRGNLCAHVVGTVALRPFHRQLPQLCQHQCDDAIHLHGGGGQRLAVGIVEHTWPVLQES